METRTMETRKEMFESLGEDDLQKTAVYSMLTARCKNHNTFDLITYVGSICRGVTDDRIIEQWREKQHTYLNPETRQMASNIADVFEAIKKVTEAVDKMMKHGAEAGASHQDDGSSNRDET